IIPVRMPVPRPTFGGVHATGRVQVDRPSAEAHPILERNLIEHIVLGEYMVADESTVFAFAGKGADPFQREILGIELSGVLDVVPDSVDCGLELVSDAFVVGDHVEFAAPFDPPVVAAVRPLVDVTHLGMEVLVISRANDGGTNFTGCPSRFV